MPEADKIKRFLVVGAATAGFYYCVLLMGVELMGFSIVATSSLAYVLSLTINYHLHYRWSFRSDRPHRKAVSRYALMNLGGFALNGMMMFSAQGANTINYLVVQTLAIAVIVMWNYMLSRYWVYCCDRT